MASLRTFHINDDPTKYYISIPILKLNSSNAYSDEFQIDEILIEEANPIKSIKSSFTVNNYLESTKPYILLRYKDETSENIRIYPGTFKYEKLKKKTQARWELINSYNFNLN